MKFVAAALLGAVSANLQINIDEKNIMKVDGMYFEYLSKLPQNSNVQAFETGLANATEHAIAEVVAAQRTYMKPDMEMYKTWIDWQTPPSGCNTTALADCMVTNTYSYSPKDAMGDCGQSTSGCKIKEWDFWMTNTNTSLWESPFDEYMDGNATAMGQALEKVGMSVFTDYQTAFMDHQADIQAIVTNYTAEVKSLYKLWPGCNMTCVNASDFEDLVSDDSFNHCDCDPYMKISQSSTPFNQTTGDIEFATTTDSTTDTTTDTTTDAKTGGNTTTIIIIVVVVLLVAVAGFMVWKKKQATVANEGGEYLRV